MLSPLPCDGAFHDFKVGRSLDIVDLDGLDEAPERSEKFGGKEAMSEDSVHRSDGSRDAPKLRELDTAGGVRLLCQR